MPSFGSDASPAEADLSHCTNHQPANPGTGSTLSAKLEHVILRIDVRLRDGQLKHKKSVAEVLSIRHDLDKLRGEIGRSGEAYDNFANKQVNELN